MRACIRRSSAPASAMRDSRTWRKCSGSCACTSIPGRGRWKSYRRESQKRSAAGAQHRRPRLALERAERPHRVVGGEQRPRRAPSSSAVVCFGEAPVVRAHRHVVEQAVDAGEVEVDHAGDAPVLEQRVVAEQIRVHRAARQVGKAVLAPGIRAPLPAACCSFCRETACTSLRREAPPLRRRADSPGTRCTSARRDACARAARRARRNAPRSGCSIERPGEPRHQRGGLAVQSVPRYWSDRSAIGAGQGMPWRARCAIRSR